MNGDLLEPRGPETRGGMVIAAMMAVGIATSLSALVGLLVYSLAKLIW